MSAYPLAKRTATTAAETDSDLDVTVPVLFMLPTIDGPTHRWKVPPPHLPPWMSAFLRSGPDSEEVIVGECAHRARKHFKEHGHPPENIDESGLILGWLAIRLGICRCPGCGPTQPSQCSSGHHDWVKFKCPGNKITGPVFVVCFADEA